MIRKTIWVDPELWKKARIVALEKNEPFWKLLGRALEKEIEKHETKKIPRNPAPPGDNS